MAVSSLAAHLLLLRCDSTSEGSWKCTPNPNVPRQYSGCPWRYETQYQPVRTYIMQLQSSEGSYATRCKSTTAVGVGGTGGGGGWITTTVLCVPHLLYHRQTIFNFSICMSLFFVFGSE